ncbi:MAG TPA: DUF4331 domain-containing protein [Kofleriaceae bacterium]|nr:DUF4331 domain-containing protein [Kofleriaceae bacterium]
MALAFAAAPSSGWASSHREAPFITKNPKVDGTDFYMFDSYEPGRSGYVTLLANYLPLQDAAGGPNFFGLDPDALYEIHVDNNGDAQEDITFQFAFQQTLSGGTGIALQIGPSGNTKSVAVPFVAVGPVSAGNEGSRNVMDTYTLNIIRGPRRTGTSMPVVKTGTSTATFEKPLDNIGNKTIADYATYASSFIYNVDIPGCTPPAGTHARVFVGQRREGFAVNLGQVFDLVNFNTTGAGGLANVVGAEDQGFNTIANKNITTLALEVPASCLTSGTSTIIGGWTTASVRQARVINPTGTFSEPSREGGPWVQVSRLGMPLVNEVVIGLPDKDKFNGSEPKDDAQFADYVTNPTLPEVLELLFGGAGVRAPTNFPRTDLVTAFLTGVPMVNADGSTAELLRLNTGVPATAAASQNNYGAALCFDPSTATANAKLDLGATGCDPAGFPNGRRPGDDVVDIELRVAMGYLVDTTDAPSSHLPIVDGAGVSSAAFDTTFPYLKTPVAGSP